MKKILLVEDDEMNRDMLSRRLESRGFEVVTAVDGLQGMEKALNDSPDLILMDMNLPGIDGWEATRRIRERETETRVPIIAVTAHAMSQDHAMALNVGCDHYEAKPIQLASLLEKIYTLLESSP